MKMNKKLEKEENRMNFLGFLWAKEWLWREKDGNEIPEVNWKQQTESFQYRFSPENSIRKFQCLLDGECLIRINWLFGNENSKFPHCTSVDLIPTTIKVIKPLPWLMRINKLRFPFDYEKISWSQKFFLEPFFSSSFEKWRKRHQWK